MDKPFKIDEIRQYTESVYFDADGTEVHRERNYDDFWFDSGEPEPLTDDEMEDFFPEMLEDDDE